MKKEMSRCLENVSSFTLSNCSPNDLFKAQGTYCCTQMRRGGNTILSLDIVNDDKIIGAQFAWHVREQLSLFCNSDVLVISGKTNVYKGSEFNVSTPTIVWRQVEFSLKYIEQQYTNWQAMARTLDQRRAVRQSIKKDDKTTSVLHDLTTPVFDTVVI